MTFQLLRTSKVRGLAFLLLFLAFPATALGANVTGDRLPKLNQTTATKQQIHHGASQVKLERLSGSNAIETSVAVSKKYYSAGTQAVYIAQRAAYADAIIAGTMKTRGPILYVNTDSLPASVSSELQRLRPAKVVIFGGSSVVNDNVMQAIKKAVPASSAVERISGSDRFATAASVSRSQYPTGADTAYLANGDAYADAIAATQQGATGPLLYGRLDNVPGATLTELKRLKAKHVIILGTNDVVSDQVANSIKANTGAKVTRIGGVDRYATAADLSRQLYPTGIDQVYIANGTAYADAIVISSIPQPGAMLYVRDTSVAKQTQIEIERLGATKATIVGGDIRVDAATSKKIEQILNGNQVIKKIQPGISYFVMAHPDDELSAWSLIQASEYPVFILATQGEASSRCNANGGIGSQQCKDRRVGSFHSFLDNYYTVANRGKQPGGYHLYIGQDSARLIFDLGDGNLTANEVTSAINQARQVDYGIYRENYVSSGSYWDTKADPACGPPKTSYQCGLYDHADHRAVYTGVSTYSHANRITIHGHYNPLVNAGTYMGDDLLNTMLACPNGPYNQAYAWLRLPCWTRENSRWDSWNWIKDY